jgi:ubiquinone/menaquinone biosynthesis C-methylase UbiE
MPHQISDWDQAYKQKPYIQRKPHPAVIDFGKLLGSSSADLILDLGCGDGRHLSALSEVSGSTIGLDKSVWGIRRSQQRLRLEGIPSCLTCGDMVALPFVAECFEAVISIQVIHHNLRDEMLKTIDEIFRVLRCGGYLLLSVAKFHSGGLWKRECIEIEPNTYVPKEGFEAGIPHHTFTQESLIDAMSAFEIQWLHEDLESPKHLIGLFRKP